MQYYLLHNINKPKTECKMNSLILSEMTEKKKKIIRTQKKTNRTQQNKPISKITNKTPQISTSLLLSSSL